MQKIDGFMPLYWEESAGRMWMEISGWDTDLMHMMKRFVRRHGLEKRNPSQAVSEAVEPWRGDRPLASVRQGPRDAKHRGV